MDAEIVVFGSINLDFLYGMDTLPEAGQTRLARDLTVQPGGKGANQAVAARLAGATVAMVGAVGDDGLATPALAVMERAGVDLANLQRLPGRVTGCASICTDPQGRNQISVALGANAGLLSDHLPEALLRPGAVLVSQLETDLAQVAEVVTRARAAGMAVVLNLAPMRDLPERTLRQASLLVVNEDEAEALGRTLDCGPSAASLHERLGVVVIRTLGAEGAEAFGPEGHVSVAAHRVRAVDTTAAGDCFVGTLAANLVRGASLAETMSRACAAAAVACTRRGSQASLPTPAEVAELLGCP